MRIYFEVWKNYGMECSYILVETFTLHPVLCRKPNNYSKSKKYLNFLIKKTKLYLSSAEMFVILGIIWFIVVAVRLLFP